MYHLGNRFLLLSSSPSLHIIIIINITIITITTYHHHHHHHHHLNKTLPRSLKLKTRGVPNKSTQFAIFDLLDEI